jgi:hypothetical protein
MRTHRPWYDRLFAALPRLPDWYLPVMIMVGLVMLGFALGLVVCDYRHPKGSTAGVEERLPLRRLEALEQRMQALEGKGAP